MKDIFVCPHPIFDPGPSQFLQKIPVTMVVLLRTMTTAAFGYLSLFRKSAMAFGSLPVSRLAFTESARHMATNTRPLHPPMGIPGSLRHFTSLRASSSDNVKIETAKSPVPITLLSGFLGTGKTTALKHLLETNDNKKIGVIVNDVAAVNIDAKLIQSQSSDMVELQNGCACCSLADELFFSVEKILLGRDLDAIVVELSGVADPMAIRNNWKMAPSEVRDMADIARVVTLVDSQTFGTDYMTWDTAADRPGWTNPVDPCAGNAKVAELLAEQVEAANLVLINKCDLSNAEEVLVAEKVTRALNGKTNVEKVVFGKIVPKLILGTVEEITAACTDPACDDESHSHSHTQDHGCMESGCNDSSHSHAHDHACVDAGCTDVSHEHSHAHSESTCADPDCTDATHEHTHSHSTSTDQLGIVNFVYKAAVPFEPKRLMTMLETWPIPLKDTLDLGFLQEEQTKVLFEDGMDESPFNGVLRSKGFCWFGPSKWSGANSDAWRHETAMYWSHAGKHFSITSGGKWWGTMPREKMKKFFDENMAEFDRIVRDDFVSEEFGDRRQEIVFIGIGLNENEIRAAMDECLMTESEMAKYRQNLQNLLATTMATSSGPSLFDVGTIDHADTK